ncbi:MAG TPA: O-antigen ligase family protein [Rhodanobacteraceae bacterium]|nr:O-antigen ligase family protein [Rhodanobacteraceae bacterium]
MSFAAAHPSRRRPSPAARPQRAPADPRERLLFVLSGVLLSVAFITGGSSQESGWGVMIAELLALVVLLFVLSRREWRARLATARWGVVVACLIVAIPLLQLLPIPAWLWQWPSPRAALQHDLAAGGVTGITHHWSLSPATTERDLFMLLPGFALCMSALALPREAWRRLLWWFIALVAFSVVLAFGQLGAPQDSFLNPVPQYAPALAGVFANRNHQACALAMGLVLALTLLFDARSRMRRGEATHASVLACGILAALFAAILPLVGSRAGVIIAIVGAAAALLANGAWSPRRWHEQRAARWLSALALAALALGVYGAFAWMQQDVDVAGSRWQMAGAAARLAGASLPLGGGAGSFVRMFEQFTQGALMHQGYINAAHNDYIQWWYAGGVLAIAAIIAAAAALIVATLRLLKLQRESRSRMLGMAALLAILMPVLHSTVDYPLRTPALMTAFGMLAGIAVAAGVRAKQHHGNPVAAPAAPTVGATEAATTKPRDHAFP